MGLDGVLAEAAVLEKLVDRGRDGVDPGSVDLRDDGSPGTIDPPAGRGGRRRAIGAGAAVQKPAAPNLALWNRIEGFDANDLDRALADGAIVKASLFRFTLHAVHAGGLPWAGRHAEPPPRSTRPLASTATP